MAGSERDSEPLLRAHGPSGHGALSQLVHTAVTTMEQEARVKALFKQLEAGFKAHERLTDDAKAEAKLKELVELLKDVKSCAPPACRRGGRAEGRRARRPLQLRASAREPAVQPESARGRQSRPRAAGRAAPPPAGHAPEARRSAQGGEGI